MQQDIKTVNLTEDRLLVRGRNGWNTESGLSKEMSRESLPIPQKTSIQKVYIIK